MLCRALENFCGADACIEGNAFEESQIGFAMNAAVTTTCGHCDRAAGNDFIIIVRLVELGKKFFGQRLFAAAVDPAVELG